MSWMWFHDNFEPTEKHLHGYTKYIAGYKTDFQKIEIIYSPFYGKMLIIDGDVQSTEKDEYIYHESLVHPAMISHENPKKVLIIGGGEGATLREVLKHKDVKKVIMVDIDKKMIEFAKEHLFEWHKGSFDSEKLTLIIKDAREYIKEEKEKSFDVIIQDVTEPFEGGSSYFLFTKNYFKRISEILKDDGVFVLQASMLRCVTYEMHRKILWTLKESFRKTFSYYSYVPSFDTTWSFIFSSNSLNPKELDIEEVDKRINERVKEKLLFYDGETHKKLFLLPKDIKKILNEKVEPIEEEKPFVLPKKDSF
ncbi:MAG: polyamine aminopropyltransferase [Caldisericia bacterium]|nr:polyamine aminopropyltransferase [Caldisericia bacterium]